MSHEVVRAVVPFNNKTLQTTETSRLSIEFKTQIVVEMSKGPGAVTGGCLCGAVRYQISFQDDGTWPPTVSDLSTIVRNVSLVENDVLLFCPSLPRHSA